MAKTAHGSLTADEITTIDIEAGRTGVLVVNRNQEGVIWARVDGQDPVVEGADTYAVFGVREFPLGRRSAYQTITVKLLSDEARAYTVEAY